LYLIIKGLKLLLRELSEFLFHLLQKEKELLLRLTGLSSSKEREKKSE